MTYLKDRKPQAYNLEFYISWNYSSALIYIYQCCVCVCVCVWHRTYVHKTICIIPRKIQHGTVFQETLKAALQGKEIILIRNLEIRVKNKHNLHWYAWFNKLPLLTISIWSLHVGMCNEWQQHMEKERCLWMS